jgi:hypothetical protein
MCHKSLLLCNGLEAQASGNLGEEDPSLTSSFSNDALQDPDASKGRRQALLACLNWSHPTLQGSCMQLAFGQPSADHPPVGENHYCKVLLLQVAKKEMHQQHNYAPDLGSK